MKMRICLILIFCCNCMAAISQDSSTLSCPMKKGLIVEEEDGFNRGAKGSGSIIEGKGKNIYSCSNGIIKSVNSMPGNLINVYVENEVYFFSYNGFISATLKTGDKIEAGQILGQIKRKRKWLLLVSKTHQFDVAVDPKTILKCKVVTRYNSQ